MKGHIRWRGPNTWAIKIDIGKDPVTGKRRSRWHTVHGGIRKAQAKLTELFYRPCRAAPMWTAQTQP